MEFVALKLHFASQSCCPPSEMSKLFSSTPAQLPSHHSNQAQRMKMKNNEAFTQQNLFT